MRSKQINSLSVYCTASGCSRRVCCSNRPAPVQWPNSWPQPTRLGKQARPTRLAMVHSADSVHPPPSAASNPTRIAFASSVARAIQLPQLTCTDHSGGCGSAGRAAPVPAPWCASLPPPGPQRRLQRRFQKQQAFPIPPLTRTRPRQIQTQTRGGCPFARDAGPAVCEFRTTIAAGMRPAHRQANKQNQRDGGKESYFHQRRPPHPWQMTMVLCHCLLSPGRLPMAS